MKFLKNFFTVPEGQKVTERIFKRMLISSVCGILVCMTCLMSTTWAWFQASIEKNIGPIEVARHTAVLYQNNAKVEGASLEVPTDATQEVTVVFETDADPTRDEFGATNTFGYTPGRYIVMAVYTAPAADDETATATEDPYTQYRGTFYIPATYATMDDSNEENTGPTNWHVKLQLSTGEKCKVVFSSAWNAPLEAVLAEPENGVLTLIAPSTPADETEATTEPTTETSVPATTEPKETEAKETEPKETESKETESKETESKETEPKTTEAKTE